QSATNIVLGIVLLIITVINWAVIPVSPLVTFWINLWVGLTVASLALWAALYHPKEGAVEAGGRVAADSRWVPRAEAARGARPWSRTSGLGEGGLLAGLVLVPTWSKEHRRIFDEE